jgi:hypothetical protein
MIAVEEKAATIGTFVVAPIVYTPMITTLYALSATLQGRVAREDDAAVTAAVVRRCHAGCRPQPTQPAQPRLVSRGAEPPPRTEREGVRAVRRHRVATTGHSRHCQTGARLPMAAASQACDGRDAASRQVAGDCPPLRPRRPRRVAHRYDSSYWATSLSARHIP